MRLLLSRKRQQWKKATPQKKCKYENHIENYYNFGYFYHGLRTPGEEITFTARPKFTPTPRFFGTAEAYFVCHIGPNFQVSLIYAFIGCP